MVITIYDFLLLTECFKCAAVTKNVPQSLFFICKQLIISQHSCLVEQQFELISPFDLQERTVTIRRQTIGGFGLSIKVI